VHRDYMEMAEVLKLPKFFPVSLNQQANKITEIKDFTETQRHTTHQGNLNSLYGVFVDLNSVHKVFYSASRFWKAYTSLFIQKN
jgi:hypothetical protein